MFPHAVSDPTKPGLLLSRFATACLLVLSFGCLISGATRPKAGQDANNAKSAEAVKPGAVIDEFTDDFSGARKAGMREGDVLLHWSRGDAGGKIESPFDLSLVIDEQLPRGPIEFEGFRGSRKMVWRETNQWWGAEVRPNFSADALAAYLETKDLAKKRKLNEAAERWRHSAAIAERSSHPWLSAWYLHKAAETFASGQLWSQSDDAYRAAIGHVERARAGTRARLLYAWSQTYYQRSDWNHADKYLQEAVLESHTAGTGNIAAKCINVQAYIAMERGDLSKSVDYFRQELAIDEQLEPGDVESAATSMNIGMVLFGRGDLAEAEKHYRAALSIYIVRAPHTNGHAFILDDLAEVARLRGDLEQAEKYYRQSLAIEEKVDPGTIEHATILSDLAKAVDQRGNSRQAEELLRQSLAIYAKLVPGSPEEAQTRQNLGDVLFHRGDLAAAKAIYLETLALREKHALESLPTAETVNSLGDVAFQRGDLARAEAYYRRALAVREKLAPGSTFLAESLADLAEIMRRERRTDEAADFYAAALNALESQTAKLGGSSDVRAGFRARHLTYYRNYADLLLLQHKAGPALAVLERSRARTLLEMLAAAHVDVHRGADPDLLKRERDLRADINAKSERRIHLLSEKHTAEQADQIEAVEKETSDLTTQYQEVEAQIRSTSPNYAALTQPQPLTAKEIQQQLVDQNTLLLEYSLGEKHSHVFAVTPDSLQVFELPAQARVERQARRVYSLLTARNHSVHGESFAQRQRRWRRADAAYQHEARALSRMILGPVAAQMKGKRLLIVADGALYYVPFAALPEPTPAKKTSLPLAVDHEIVSLPSASVLALLRQQDKDRKPAPQAVAVLADPVFDKNDPRISGRMQASAQSAAVRGTKSRGEGEQFSRSFSAGLLTRSATDLGLKRNGRLTFSRLRFTRQEADAIRAVTPSSKVLEAVDFRASRAMATSPELAKYRIVHFATHGLLNSQHPELSGLVLSLVDKQGKPRDGFLTLQDIYNMSLSADLVVLSACETGLGKEISGEGLIGMTRGFMYAGASRVVASLWKVSDVATARLMTEFYRGMEKDKLSPAAALRAAQVKMWKQRRWRSPYYWAAFQIQGEWK